MKSRLEETLDPAVVDGWNKKLLHVWDVAASVAQVAGAEVPVRLCIDGLHYAVIAAKDVCSDFHIDDNNTSSYAFALQTTQWLHSLMCFLTPSTMRQALCWCYRWRGLLQFFLVPIPIMEPFVLCCLWIIYMIVVSQACSMEPMRMNITTWESNARCNR